jgi:hypothetical protein
MQLVKTMLGRHDAGRLYCADQTAGLNIPDRLSGGVISTQERPGRGSTGEHDQRYRSW